MNGGSLALYVTVEVLFKAAQILHCAHAPHAQRGRSCCLLGSRLCQHRSSAAVAVRGVQPLPPARPGQEMTKPITGKPGHRRMPSAIITSRRALKREKGHDMCKTGIHVEGWLQENSQSIDLQNAPCPRCKQSTGQR